MIYALRWKKEQIPRSPSTDGSLGMTIRGAFPQRNKKYYNKKNAFALQSMPACHPERCEGPENNDCRLTI